MRPTRSSLRRAAGGAAAAVLVTGMLAVAAPAQAKPTVNAATPAGAMELASQFGARSAGTYLDAETGRMVVTVTSAADARTVRSAGGVARVVPRSGADLKQATDALDASARIPGTAWAVDPVANQVVVSVDATVTGDKLAKVRSIARGHGEAVRIERTSGTLTTLIAGGQAIYAGGSRCSLGFNVRNSAGTEFFITAGHCTNIASSWYGSSGGGTFLGTRTGTSFPGNDYGIVRYDSSVARPGTVYLYSGTQEITSAGNAVVGQSVRRSGSTTGVRSGSVTATNATVNYPQGTVTGLIRTNVCAEPGDSGGSLFAGTTALGLTSGGSGNCSSGGTTYFQPVPEVLSRYSVSVY